MTPNRRLRALAATAALLVMVLAGCAGPVAFDGETIACRVGDDGEPANGVILMAQAVPSATWVPCLDVMPLGWHVSEVDVRNGRARFWLASDRDGPQALEIRLTESCRTSGATEIPSERDGMARLEKVTEVFPRFVGERFYVFDGGCIRMLFTLAGSASSEPLAVATQGIDVVSRTDLRDHVRAESVGRLELDPPTDADGGP